MQAMRFLRLVVAIGVLIAASASQGSSLELSASRHRASSAAVHAPRRVSTGARISQRAAATTDCQPCAAAASTRARGRHIKKARPCHPPDYVDPKVRADLYAAMRELKRVGVTPKVNSAWRSSDDQGRMYKCSSSRRCRLRHPGLFRAMPPGQSAHEAGFALDIGGVAAGPRGAKHLTPQGRRIVQVMEKHGFNWKYGLADPVHFEADPREHGYRNLKQAIQVTQTRCQASVLARAAGRTRGLEKRTTPVRSEARSRPYLRHRA